MSKKQTQDIPPIDLLEDETLSQKLVKKWFWLYFFSLLMWPAGYLIKLMISNSWAVSVADIGVLYSIISLVGFLNVYNDLGLTESLQYFLPRYRVKKQYNNIKTTIRLSFLAQFITAIVIAVILWFGADWLAAHYFQSEAAAQILRFFCFYFLGINLFQTLQSIFIAFQKTFDYQLVEFIKIWWVVGFTALIFFSDKQSITWYALTWLIGLAIWILVAIILYKKKYHRSLMQGEFVYDKPVLKEYVQYALRAFLGLNAGVVFFQLTQQLIILVLGPEAAGYYTNFSSLMNISAIIIWPIIGLIFPMVSELTSKKDDHKIRLLFHFFYTYFFIVALSMAAILITLWPEIAVILFGERFLLSWQLLVAWGIFSVIIILTNFNFSVLAGMWKIKERVKMMAISVGFLFIVTLIGMYVWQLYWAVIWFWLAYLLLGVLSLVLLRKDVIISVWWKFVIKNIVLLVVLGVVLWVIKWGVFVLDDTMRWANLWKLVVIVLLFYAIFVGFNYKEFGVLSWEVKKLRG